VKDTAREKYENAMKAVRKRFNTWGDSLPKCADTCDGDVEGEEHDADCPVGKAGGFATMFDAYAAGRAEGIEECLKFADEYYFGYEVANAIRALAKDGQ
jgi:hypothetical protein